MREHSRGGLLGLDLLDGLETFHIADSIYHRIDLAPERTTMLQSSFLRAYLNLPPGIEKICAGEHNVGMMQDKH
jgi:hypothetical protein